MGRTWLMGMSEDIVWYNKYDGERSANNIHAELARSADALAFVVGGNWVNTRERPGFEIDARANRKELAAMARSRSERCHGRCSARELNTGRFFRRGRLVPWNEPPGRAHPDDHERGRTVRHELTPLTSLPVDVGRQQERFDFFRSETPMQHSQHRTAIRPVRIDQWNRAGRLQGLHTPLIRCSPLHRQHGIGEPHVRRAGSNEAWHRDRPRRADLVRLQSPLLPSDRHHCLDQATNLWTARHRGTH